MSRFLRSLPAQLLLVTILPFTLVLAAVAFGSVAMHQQAMRQMVSERDMRTVMATSLMLSDKPVTAFLFDSAGHVLYHTSQAEVSSNAMEHGGIRERAGLIHATVSMASAPAKGTTLVVRLPAMVWQKLTVPSLN